MNEAWDEVWDLIGFGFLELVRMALGLAGLKGFENGRFLMVLLGS